MAIRAEVSRQTADRAVAISTRALHVPQRRHRNSHIRYRRAMLCIIGSAPAAVQINDHLQTQRPRMSRLSSLGRCRQGTTARRSRRSRMVGPRRLRQKRSLLASATSPWPRTRTPEGKTANIRRRQEICHSGRSTKTLAEKAGCWKFSSRPQADKISLPR